MLTRESNNKGAINRSVNLKVQVSVEVLTIFKSLNTPNSVDGI